MGLFCLSRHLRLLFRSQSRSGGVERVRGCHVCTDVCVCVFVMWQYSMFSVLTMQQVSLDQTFKMQHMVDF